MSDTGSIDVPSTILPDYDVEEVRFVRFGTLRQIIRHDPRFRRVRDVARRVRDRVDRVREHVRRICRIPPPGPPDLMMVSGWIEDSPPSLHRPGSPDRSSSSSSRLTRRSDSADSFEAAQPVCLRRHPPAYHRYDQRLVTEDRHAGPCLHFLSPLERDMLRDPAFAQRIQRERERHRDFHARAMAASSTHVPTEIPHRRPRPPHPPPYDDIHPRSVYPRTGPPTMRRQTPAYPPPKSPVLSLIFRQWIH